MVPEDALHAMDQLERLLLRQGWPIPFTPYSLVHQGEIFRLMDRLRGCLKDKTNVLWRLVPSDTDEPVPKRFFITERTPGRTKTGVACVPRQSASQAKGETL